MASMKSDHRVLIYHHLPDYVDRYEQFIRKAREDLLLFPCKNEDQIDQAIGEAEIVFSGHMFPVIFFVKAKNLKWIQSMSAGIENFIQSKTIPSGVILTKIEGVFGPIMSEYVVGYILAITQNMKKVFTNQKDKIWQAFLVDSIRRKTIGVMGLGSIGAYIAYQLHLLGAEVIGFDEQAKKLPYLNQEYSSTEIEDFLGRSDFVVVTLPLTNKTKGILGEKELKMMKKSAYLINISRGPIIQEKALSSVLKKGLIGGAVLDVFDLEPLPKNHEFWEIENLIITPHVSGPSIPEDISVIFLENLKRLEQGKKLKGTIDRGREY